MGRVLTYVLAALAASAAIAAVEAAQGVVVSGAFAVPNDPKVAAAAIAGWFVAFLGVAVAFLAVVGVLWALVQLALQATVGAASGVGAIVLGVFLVVALTVGGTYAMWTFVDMGVDPEAVGGLDRILLWEAGKAAGPGLAWGLVFALRGAGRPSRTTADPVGAH